MIFRFCFSGKLPKIQILMRFFDLLPFQSSDIKLPRKPKAAGSNSLDLSRKHSLRKRLTDISDSHPSKRALRYLVLQVEHKWKHTQSPLFRFGTFAVLLALIFNIISAVSTASTLEKKLRQEVQSTLENLKSAASAGSQGNLQNATELFNAGQLKLSSITQLSAELLSASDVFRNDSSLLSQSKSLLSAASHLTAATEIFLQSTETVLALAPTVLNSDTTISISEALYKEYTQWQTALDHLRAAQSDLTYLNRDLIPTTYLEPVDFLQNQLASILPSLEDSLDHFPSILELLGHSYPRRYLVLLQNKNELRPTGGFIGSVALVEFNDGHLTQLNIRDVYDFDGQIDDNVLPPPWFGKLTQTWGLRDSNYSPDFPTSAQKASYFFEKGGGPTVDAVIAINQSLVEDLLKITGPIESPNLPTPLTSENFSMQLSLFVEAKTTGEHTPKQPLIDFFPLFQSQLLTNIPTHAEEFFDVLFTARNTEQILAWSKQPDFQNFFEWLGIDGKQHQLATQEDFLEIVRTNIAGNKSDFFTADKITHQTHILADGTVENTLVLSRTHTWQNIWEIIWEKLAQGENIDTELSLVGTAAASNYAQTQTSRTYLPDNLYEILGRGANLDYTRIYLPAGSQLISAEGISLSQITEFEDLGKKVLGLEVSTLPGSTTRITIHYRLPFDLAVQNFADYQFYFQKQPGTPQQIFVKKIEVDPNLKITAAFPENLTGQAIGFENQLDTDTIYAAVITPN